SVDIEEFPSNYDSLIRRQRLTIQKVSLEELGINQGKNVVTLPNKPSPPFQEDVTTQDTRPTGKCQAPNGICRNLGYKYRIAFYDSEGLVKKELFLCEVHVKKAKEQDMEVVEI